MILNDYVQAHLGKDIGGCSDEELYAALLSMTQEAAAGKVSEAG